MPEFDVVVVGGGPAGALAARAAAQAGAKTLLLERAPRREARCAGLVSLATAERLAVPPDLVLREICGLRVFGPDGPVLALRAAHPKAVVLDRTSLDRWLLTQAQEQGVHLAAAPAKAVAPGVLHGPPAPVKFAVLVGADGAVSLVGRSLGLPRPQEILIGLQAVVEAELGDEVHVFLGVIPDFFAWAVPAEEGRARVGLATREGRAAQAGLRALLKTWFPTARVRQVQAGLIPLGPPPRTAQGDALLVGNAAGQVKPLTGGGLAFIARCAPLAGELAAQGRAGLHRYEQAWRGLIGEELAFQLAARKAFLRLGPVRAVQLFKALPQKLGEFLAQEGEIDSLSSLPRKVRNRPDLWPALLALWRWLPRELLG
ncbi:MAG: NAD(P)/FAD-dependent oxidoreductase [Candidatus Bipolaricaulaceae bacterium]